MTISFPPSCRHLDLSHSDERSGQYPDADALLASVAESLPALTSLDISGTNLAGKGGYSGLRSREAAKRGEDIEENVSRWECDVPGLACRVGNPLEFLGLYRTSHEACCRKQIPAKTVRHIL